MDKILVVVANRTGARIFQFDGPTKGFRLLEVLEHPEGRMRNKDIDSARPGTSYDSHGTGKHGMAPEVDPTEQEARRFASKIAENLDRRRKANELNKIILAAEGGFLGTLRDSMTKETTLLITDSLSKDLTNVTDQEIGGYFDNILPVR